MMTSKPNANQLNDRIRNLEEESSFFKSLIDNTYDWETFRDTTGKLIYSNNAFERITGYPVADYLAGKISDYDFVHPIDADRFKEFIEHSKVEALVEDFEFGIVRKDGSIRHLNLYANPVYQENIFVGTRASARDITEQKDFKELEEITEELEETQNRFEVYIQNSTTAVYIVDIDGRYTYVNPSACRILGYSEEEILELSIPDLLSPDSLSDGLKSFQDLIADGASRNVELQLVHKQGHFVDILLDSFIISENEYISYVKDITALKDTERKLQEQNEEYSTLNEEYLTSL